MEEEKWLPVVGYPRYEVSSLGRLRTSLESLLTARRKASPRVLKPFLNPHGYLQIGLYSDGKQWLTQVHRHVALAFLGSPPDGKPYVNHKDLNKSNNSVTNLEWVSALENMAHAFGAGRLTCMDGHRPGQKLTIELANEIRRLSQNEDMDTLEISQRLGVHRASVLDVVSGKSWMPASDCGRPPRGRGTSAMQSPGKSRGLTRESVLSIRRMYATLSITKAEIARMYGVAPSSIRDVLTGKTWKDIT